MQRNFWRLRLPKPLQIDYIIVRDSIICFACRHFVTTSGFVTPLPLLGFGWAQQSRINDLASSETHNDTMSEWQDWKASQDNDCISAVMCGGNEKLIAEKRLYMKSVQEALIFLAQQGLAFQGHREGELTDGVRNTNLLEFQKADESYRSSQLHREVQLTGMKNASSKHTLSNRTVLPRRCRSYCERKFIRKLPQRGDIFFAGAMIPRTSAKLNR